MGPGGLFCQGESRCPEPLYVLGPGPAESCQVCLQIIMETLWSKFIKLQVYITVAGQFMTCIDNLFD